MTKKQNTPQIRDDQAVMRNQVVEASYRLPTRSQRLLRCLVREVESGELTRRLPLKQVLEYMGEDEHRQHLDEAAKGLTNRGLVLKGQTTLYANFFASIEVDVANGWIEFEVSEKMNKLYTAGYFTPYNMRVIQQFSNPYTFQIYDLIKQYWNMPKDFWDKEKKNKMYKREVALPDLRRHLQTPKSYDLFFNLQKKILEPAIDEINTHSDLKVEMHVERGKKRKPVAVVFLARLKDTSEEKEPIESFPEDDSWVKWLRKLKPALHDPQIAEIYNSFIRTGRGEELHEVYNEVNAVRSETEKFSVRFFSRLQARAKNSPEPESSVPPPPGYNESAPREETVEPEQTPSPPPRRREKYHEDKELSREEIEQQIEKMRKMYDE